MTCCGECFTVCQCVDHVEIWGTCEARIEAWELEDSNFEE